MNSAGKNGELGTVKALTPPIELPEISPPSLRKEINDPQVYAAVEQLMSEMFERLNQPGGRKSNVSSHEIQGGVTEEYFQLIEATRGGIPERIKKELLDIAIVCIFGAACVDAGAIEW